MPFPRSTSFSIASIFALVFLAGLQSQAFAADDQDVQADTYFGADLVYNNLAIEEGDVTYTPLTARLRLGIKIFPDLIPSFSLEAHFAFDVTEDEQTVNGQNRTLKMDHTVSLFARPYYEFSDDASIYGLVGFSVVQLEGNTGFIGDDTDSSISVGAGAMFALPFNINGQVEAIQLITGDKFDVFALSFGVSIPI